MALLKETIRQLVRGEAALRDVAPPPVLITGETGAGKEVVARAIHDEDARAARPFVEINCGSIPGNLLESELFGRERGAFTDARERKIGLVEAAEGGTLFLDEIGDMELALQVKLLRVLEERTIRRLGSIRDRAVNVRIVSATNRSLEELVAAGRFRADLLFRLRIVALHVPPLRPRRPAGRTRVRRHRPWRTARVKPRKVTRQASLRTRRRPPVPTRRAARWHRGRGARSTHCVR